MKHRLTPDPGFWLKLDSDSTPDPREMLNSGSGSTPALVVSHLYWIACLTW